jgi:lipid A 4'-phosphatase
MGRSWVLGAIAVGAVTGILFAIFPQWDLEIAGWFWDPVAGKFPLSITWLPNLARKIGDLTTWLLVLLPAGALVAKLVFPSARMLIRPSIALYLICSFAIGPGLVTNGLLKPLWARPRPVFVEQFAGQQHFEPWWRPGGDCPRNCSFVSGDASQAFWLLAPASLAPAPVRPLALATAAVFASGLSGMRVAFGRHFLTDVVFAAVLTINIIALCYHLFFRIRDADLEKGIERLAHLLRSPSALGMAVRQLVSACQTKTKETP